jgi:hypothetical protein
VRRATPLAACVLAGSVLIQADDMNINYDPHVDFSQFKTFHVREKKITSARPELDNPLFTKMLERTVESALEAKGLTETEDLPGLFVDFRITGEDVSTTRRGSSVTIGRGRSMSTGPQSVRYTVATLVIDLVRPGDPMPIWRGVYRDDESTGSKLVQKLPEDAKKLLARYPPKK